jgi:hypothetical protein
MAITPMIIQLYSSKFNAPMNPPQCLQVINTSAFELGAMSEFPDYQEYECNRADNNDSIADCADNFHSTSLAQGY